MNIMKYFLTSSFQGHEHESSMMMDIKNKNKMEIDALNGKIVEMANS